MPRRKPIAIKKTMEEEEENRWILRITSLADAGGERADLATPGGIRRTPVTSGGAWEWGRGQGEELTRAPHRHGAVRRSLPTGCLAQSLLSG